MKYDNIKSLLNRKIEKEAMCLNTEHKSELFSDIWKGLNVQCYEEITSTNDQAKYYLKQYPQDEFLIISKTQTKGRGRNGRSFYSKIDHGLYFTLGIKVKEINPKDLPLYTIAVATAMMITVEKELGIKLKVKWVNDLFYQGNKVAGILSEVITNSKTNKITSVIIGIGLNLAGSFQEADTEVQEIAGTLYEQLPENFNYIKFLQRFLREFKLYHQNIEDKHFLPLYEQRMLGIGKEVRYERNQTTYYGIITGINKHGHLIVQTSENKLVTLYSDEIHFSSGQFKEEVGEWNENI